MNSFAGITDNDPVVLIAMARTSLGAFMGNHANTAAPVLGASAIRAAVDRSGIGSDQIQQVTMGCVLSAGTGQAPARQASRLAGLPDSVSSATVNKVCGSGMFALELATHSLLLGQADFCVAGGMENMSLAPHLMPGLRNGMRLGAPELQDHIFTDGLNDAYTACSMGAYADDTARNGGFNREDQDAYALASLTRSRAAIEQHVFEPELCHPHLASAEPENACLSDELPGKAKPEKIPILRPAFRESGTVTAANASSLADGAAAIVLTRRSVAEAHGLKTIAVLDGISHHAQSPETFALAPIQAISKLLSSTNRSAADIDVWEINEAFALVPMAAMRAHKLDHDKVNVHGGACALGHPLGATGARIVVTLLGAMLAQDKELGVASLCIGGGEAMALSLRRL